MEPYVRILIYEKTRRILKVAAVLQGTTVTELVNRLATAELERVNGEKEAFVAFGRNVPAQEGANCVVP